MKYQVLFFLFTISFLSYSTQEPSWRVGLNYVGREIDFRGPVSHNTNNIEFLEVKSNLDLIRSIPLTKQDAKECQAIIERAAQESKSAEGVIEWIKDYHYSRADRKTR